ncbi:MAG: hypothetical protein K2K70_02285, partial [Lachnospiraceae bacterium]|nr:hypothetical protein [Lachnospiraceae bacterium]
MKYRIADTVIQLEVANKFMHPGFKPFVCEAEAPVDLSCDIAILEDFREAVQITMGQLALVTEPRIRVFEGAIGIDLVYPQNQYLTSISINRDQTEAQIFVIQDREGKWADELYHALKDVVLLVLERKGKIVLDASSILCEERVVLLSKDPGAKFASLCVEQGMGYMFHESMTVCGVEGETIYAYGTPWSDTTQFNPERAVLGGIVFIKKSEVGAMVDLQPDKRQLFMVVRLLSPVWREGLLDLSLIHLGRCRGFALWGSRWAPFHV